MYEALELGQPDSPACPDRYTRESSLLCPGSRRLILQVSAQAVFVQFGRMRAGLGVNLAAIQWEDEMPFLPCMGHIPRQFDAVRVRNYTPGTPAQVLISVQNE